MQNLNDEKEIVLRSNCKDPKLELCKTALKNILSPTNQPDDAILKVLKALQECELLIEKSEITYLTDNFIKFSEDLFSELHEVSLYINDIIECFTIILNDTAKVNDLIDMLEASLSPNEFIKRISCVEGLGNSLDKIDNEIRKRLMSNYENRSINNKVRIDKIQTIKENEFTTIKIQLERLIEFWKSHNYLIDNLLKLLNDHKKKSNYTLEIPKIDYDEIVSLWTNVKDKCNTDYLRANHAIVEGLFHTDIDISSSIDVGRSNIYSDPANINNNGDNGSFMASERLRLGLFVVGVVVAVGALGAEGAGGAVNYAVSYVPKILRFN